MSPFFRLRCELEVLTPMFLGGADPNVPEVRAPSIRGAMRFWYRALDPSYDSREHVIFGAGGDRVAQSLLMVRCREEEPRDRISWQDVRAGAQTMNGLAYLGYPFGMGDNVKRRAIRPGTQISVEVSCRGPRSARDPDTVAPLRAALASIWALGHFGALGSRARRGFGAIALKAWWLEDRAGNSLEGVQDFTALPLLASAPSEAAWQSGAQDALALFEQWFGSYKGDEQGGAAPPPRHLHFGPKANFVVGALRHKRAEWRGALAALGAVLQGFRQRQQPDYDLVKKHVLAQLKDGRGSIARAPDRATFGLPLMFQFRSVPKGDPVKFTPLHGERHGSSLFLRPVLAADTMYPLFLRLDGDVPGMDTRVALRRADWSLERPANNALDAFMAHVKGNVGR